MQIRDLQLAAGISQLSNGTQAYAITVTDKYLYACNGSTALRLAIWPKWFEEHLDFEPSHILAFCKQNARSPRRDVCIERQNNGLLFTATGTTGQYSQDILYTAESSLDRIPIDRVENILQQCKTGERINTMPVMDWQAVAELHNMVQKYQNRSQRIQLYWSETEAAVFLQWNNVVGKSQILMKGMN